MNFEWTTNENAKMTMTIYETNITLNKAACHYFDDVAYVLLGLDKDKKCIGVKPVTKEDLNHNIYDKSQLHRISLGKSYGRISNKAFIEQVSDLFELDFTQEQNYKFDASYDVVHHIMTAHL